MKKALCFLFLFSVIACNTEKDLLLRSVGNPGAVDATVSPIVTGISPTSYGVKGGITVTITGSNFAEGATVIIGGTNCPNVVVVSATEITCTLPYHFASVVDVVVSNLESISGTLLDGFSYNSYLYAANQSGSPALRRMKIDSATGAVTDLGTTVAPSGAYGVEIDPSNTWVYTAAVSADQIAGFSINHSTGDLTAIPGSPFAAGDGVDAIAVSKDGKCLIATNFYASAAVGTTSYSINQTTGAITKIADYASQTNAGFPVIDPLNRFVFVTNYGSDSISAYTLNTATCTMAVVGHYPCGDQPDAISVHPSGKFIYAGLANSTGGLVSMMVDQITGALSLINTYVTSNATNGSGVEIEKTGGQVYVTARGGGAPGAGKVFGYNINATSGELTVINNWTTSNGPNDVRILGSGKFVFTANTESNTINVFNRDLSTGNLTPATTPSYTIGNSPGIIAITF